MEVTKQLKQTIRPYGSKELIEVVPPILLQKIVEYYIIHVGDHVCVN